jgi:hypothetical protein
MDIPSVPVPRVSLISRVTAKGLPAVATDRLDERKSPKSAFLVNQHHISIL